MTKELKASAPSGMEIKVVAPPDNIISTVGTKTLPWCGSVVPSNVSVAWRVGGKPKKTAGFTPRGAARGRTFQEGPSARCRLAVSPAKLRVPHCVRCGQEPHIAGGTKRALQVGGEPRETAGPTL